ncbi:MAG TPA: HdeA/HdeB family chaperone [Acidobacteriaceae bacterium]|jgi:hypothetical protein|nr:HdeA/HdeB family chaperone [Acidobacteriaceae bacterium]
MKHLFTALFVLTSVATASAEVIDFSAETCQQFRGTSKDRLEVILGWLDGYYKRENDAPSMNLQVVSSNEKKLMDYCAEHPEVSLFTATAKLFDK